MPRVAAPSLPDLLMTRSLALLAALLAVLPAAAQAEDNCHIKADLFFQPSGASGAFARTWSPLELLLRRAPQATDFTPGERWHQEDPEAGHYDKADSIDHWRKAVESAERARFDYQQACLPSGVEVAFTCANASALLWKSGPVSQPYAKEWSAGEILIASLEPDVPAAWVDPRGATEAGERTAHWQDASRWALALFHALASSCAPEALVPPSARLQPFKPPEPAEVLTRHPELRRRGAPILPYVLGVPAEVSSPKGFQFALSQLVTGSQAAFAPTIAGSPFAKSEDEVLRHSTLAFNLLFVQPPAAVGGPGTTWSAPIFSSGDIFVGTTTEKSAFDWQNAVRRDADKNQRQVDELQRAAFLQLVATYRQLARGEQDRPAFLSAYEIARQRFIKAVDEYVQAAYVRPVEEANEVIWNVFARVRYTLDATWTPEIPDLFNASVGARIVRQLSHQPNQPRLSGTVSLTAGLSAFPTTDYLKVSDVGGGLSKRAALVDGSVGVLMELPDSSAMPNSKLALSALTRFTPVGRFDYSFGGTASLILPVTENMSVAAAYTLRCNPARPPCFGTSGITFGGTFVP